MKLRTDTLQGVGGGQGINHTHNVGEDTDLSSQISGVKASSTHPHARFGYLEGWPEGLQASRGE